MATRRSSLASSVHELQDLEAIVCAEVHVHRRAHLPAEPVLNLGQALGEVAHVVVVDDGQSGDRIRGGVLLGARDLRADEIAQDLRPCGAARLDDAIQLLEQAPLHGHAESNELHAACVPRLRNDG